MEAHFNDVIKVKNNNITSDSFASHFSKHLRNNISKSKDVKELLQVKILWQGDPILVRKGFGTERCQLYMNE